MIDQLRRTYARVEGFTDFHPGERIWWIYLRNAAIEVTSRSDLPDLREACHQLNAFPETVIYERGKWLVLRDAVATFLAQVEGC